MTGRPQNDLLRQLNHQDFELLAPHLQPVELEASHVLHHAGDDFAADHFPCGPVLVSFAVPVEDDREVEGLLVGREGAVVITAGRSPSLAHSRMVVKLGGTAHEQLAGMLGVSRSYASRVIQMFKARRILATRRGAILILDAAALEARACCCNDWVKKHFDEVRGGAATAEG